MSTSLSGNGTLLDDKPTFSRTLRILAHFFSWVFHPLFIPLYVTIFLSYIHPYAFVALSEKGKIFKILFVFVNTALFPGAAVFLMWRLKFIQSMFLRTQRERIIPYAAAMVFYFWAWYVSRSLQDSEELFTGFLFGSFLTVIAAWLANIYFKVSMHAMAIGGMVFFIMRVSFADDGTSGLYPSLALLIGGIVCTSRMIVSDHKPVEIYSGLLLGVLCQVLAIVF
jgi:hypothetical protein